MKSVKYIFIDTRFTWTFTFTVTWIYNGLYLIVFCTFFCQFVSVWPKWKTRLRKAFTSYPKKIAGPLNRLLSMTLRWNCHRISLDWGEVEPPKWESKVPVAWNCSTGGGQLSKIAYYGRSRVKCIKATCDESKSWW